MLKNIFNKKNKRPTKWSKGYKWCIGLVNTEDSKHSYSKKNANVNRTDVFFHVHQDACIWIGTVRAALAAGAHNTQPRQRASDGLCWNDTLLWTTNFISGLLMCRNSAHVWNDSCSWPPRAAFFLTARLETPSAHQWWLDKALCYTRNEM